MNPNVEAYAWAEQMNRLRLSAQSTRGWLADEVLVSCRSDGIRAIALPPMCPRFIDLV